MTILIHAEQGFGDSIQFVRYVPLLAARGARVILECQAALATLFNNIEGVACVVPAGEALPKFDLQLPLLSLPGVFRTTLESVPATVPYLSIDAVQARRWAGALPRGRKKRKVGIVWAGGTSDPRRDCSLKALAPLAGIPDTVFVSLQKGEAASQGLSPPPGMPLIDPSGDLRDFADTAALISRLDLVISVDTSVAHLAGALGKPVWTLLRFAPDWRWLLGRNDCPWYPTMRLYRQHAPGDWSRAVTQLADDLGR
jgi:hypothetical protein